MRIVNLNEAQVVEIENLLSEYDKKYISYTTNGKIQLGIEADGKIIAGLDACITAFRILYVSTVFVDANYRRKGYGTLLVNEMEARAKEMGVNTIDGYAEFFFLKRIQ